MEPEAIWLQPLGFDLVLRFWRWWPSVNFKFTSSVWVSQTFVFLQLNLHPNAARVHLSLNIFSLSSLSSTSWWKKNKNINRSICNVVSQFVGFRFSPGLSILSAAAAAGNTIIPTSSTSSTSSSSSSSVHLLGLAASLSGSGNGPPQASPQTPTYVNL